MIETIRPADPVLSWTILLVAAGLTALPTAEARSQAVCSEPVPPICATGTISGTTISEDVAHQRCIADTERYREKLATYRDCVQKSLDRTDAALEAADRLVKCLKSGSGDCHLPKED